jgi:hypothetical protein
MPDTDIASGVEEPDNNSVYIDSNGRLNAGGVAVAVLLLSALPAVDPHVVGQAYRNAGVVTVSAG